MGEENVPSKEHWLSIGEIAQRSGVAASALRFYEDQGLIASRRTAGNQRQYQRSTLRRIAFVQAAQRVGLALAEIKQALDSLPEDRTPTRADWSKLSKSWRSRLDERISELERLRDGGRWDDAREVFEQVALGEGFAEFLTLPAYDHLD